MINIKYPYSRPNISNNDIQAVTKVLKSQYLAQGNIVKNFEKVMQDKFQVRNSIVCNSGTAALHSTYKCLGLNKNNGLITTPITFLATANAARMCGSKVYFADVDKKTGLMTPETLESALKKVKFNVKIVTIVHLGGHLCDLEGISRICKKYNCYLVEDACHALGAKHYYKKQDYFVGSCKYSIATTFSFHAIKNITMGEGGCVTTNDDKLSHQIRLNICHGMEKNKLNIINNQDIPSWYYEMNDIGWNYRASEISCALGLSQFKRIEKIINKRSKIANNYKKYLIENELLTLPKIYNENTSAGWHLFQLAIDFEKLGKSKEQFINYLKKASIGSQVHYIPLILQPYYVNTTKKENLKGALYFYKRTISIPMYTGLKLNCVKYIAKIINNFFKG